MTGKVWIVKLSPSGGGSYNIRKNKSKNMVSLQGKEISMILVKTI